MKLDLNEILRISAEISARAQKLATEEQDQEFRKLLVERAPSLVCIGCGKQVEFIPEESFYQNGYFYGGGLLVDTMGWGSTKHDMSRVAVLVCDDCVEAKGITSSWLDKLSKHFEAEAQRPADYQI